jgi:Asp-tRNA(Asn)/Glu-tRNA(Gln) amidotransferase A subunit family amidase
MTNEAWRRPTCADYVAAYRDGRTTPLDVAERVVAAITAANSLNPALDAFVELHRDTVLADADASTARWRAGEPLGPLDGVPVPIKDEFDVEGYSTRAGTSFRGASPARHDATVVRRLRRAGAVPLGKTALTEIGLHGSGINPGNLTPRNPYDPARFTGGSSSGSAAAVSAGIGPVALGSDAGGSVRMPAALCGIYGLKPTFGRVPAAGGALLAWTLDHLGPLGASVDDLATFFAATAGPSSGERATQFARPSGPIGEPPPLEGLRFAWCPDFADDADPDVRATFHEALETLAEAGATVERLDLEWIQWVQRAGYVTIVTEAAASQRDFLRDHRQDYNLDTRLLLAVGERFSGAEYLHAQRVRTLIREELEAVVAKYDAFLHPTVACVAQPITDAAVAAGEVNSVVTSALTRYTFAGTLTGLPGVSVPCGFPSGLPVGLHLTGAAHGDETLLAVAKSVDAVLPSPPKPRRWHGLDDLIMGD